MDELNQLAIKGFELIKNISEDSTYGLKVQYEYYNYLFDVIESEFDSLESVYKLVQENKFKDCFRILRSIVEVTLFFWLMVHGKKYRIQRNWIITPKNKTNPEARDDTLQRWREGQKKDEPEFENIISMESVGNEIIRTVYEYEGMYEEKDKKQTGEWIPFYWQALEQYDSYTKFNSNLASIKTGNTLNEDKTKENILTQSLLYTKYIRIEAIIKNLLLNGLITKLQEDYVRIHYNFLSNFVHPTKEAFQFKKSNTMGFLASNIPAEITKEQILLYICRIQYHLLKILLERINDYNPKARIQSYREFMNDLNQKTNHFWFIDNEPSKYDVMFSEQKKKMAERFAGKEIDEVVMYYENPLERLHQYKNWTR